MSFMFSHICLLIVLNFFLCVGDLLIGKHFILFGDFNIRKYNNYAAAGVSRKSVCLSKFSNVLDATQYNVVQNCDDRYLDLIFGNKGLNISVES